MRIPRSAPIRVFSPWRLRRSRRIPLARLSLVLRRSFRVLPPTRRVPPTRTLGQRRESPPRPRRLLPKARRKRRLIRALWMTQSILCGFWQPGKKPSAHAGGQWPSVSVNSLIRGRSQRWLRPVTRKPRFFPRRCCILWSPNNSPKRLLRPMRV